MLIACPTCGRLQFDMDSVVVEIEERLRAYDDPIEVSVLGCAVNGIGEARHADFGITGAKDAGMIFSRGEPLKKVPTERARRRAVRRDRQVLRRRQHRRPRRGAGRRGARVARGQRGRERADARAPGGARGGGRRTEDEASRGRTARRGTTPIDEALSPVAGRRFSRA